MYGIFAYYFIKRRKQFRILGRCYNVSFDNNHGKKNKFSELKSDASSSSPIKAWGNQVHIAFQCELTLNELFAIVFLTSASNSYIPIYVDI